MNGNADPPEMKPLTPSWKLPCRVNSEPKTLYSPKTMKKRPTTMPRTANATAFRCLSLFWITAGSTSLHRCFEDKSWCAIASRVRGIHRAWNPTLRPGCWAVLFSAWRRSELPNVVEWFRHTIRVEGQRPKRLKCTQASRVHPMEALRREELTGAQPV